jgi:hypothetical protein
MNVPVIIIEFIGLLRMNELPLKNPTAFPFSVKESPMQQGFQKMT